MALGDADASTPAFVKANVAGKNATTASFTPPAGALLVAFGFHDTAGGNLTNTSVITSSDGAVGTGTVAGWTIVDTISKQADGSGFANGHGQVSIAVALGVAMTATTTGTNTNNPAGLYCRVVTGADTTTPIDVTPTDGTNTNAVISQAVGTATDGARVFLYATDWNLAANMTAGASQTAVVADGIGAPDMRVYVGVQNAVTSPAGSVTSSTASPATGNTNNWGVVALRPAASGAKTFDVALTATTTIAAALAGTAKPVDAALTATAAIASTAMSAKPVNAALTGTATIASTAATAKPVNAAVTGTAAIAATASSTKPVNAAIAGTATIAATAASAKPVAAALTAAVAITATMTIGAAPKLADVALTAAATITATMTVTPAGGGGGLTGEAHGPLPLAAGAVTVHTVSIAGAIT